MALFRGRGRHGSQLHLFTMLKGVVGMLRDPKHTESVFDIEDGLRDLEAYKLIEVHVKSDPSMAVMVAERFLAEPHDLDALGRLREKTLGKMFWHHIEDNGFDPDYYRKIRVETDLDYILMRVRQTHDIWHVVTGIGTDQIGEIALKAFELAQLRRPMAAVIAAGGVIRYMMKEPDEMGSVLEAIAYGYRMGASCRPFLAQKWEEHWDRPLENWRTQLGVSAALAEMPYELKPGRDAVSDTGAETEPG